MKYRLFCIDLDGTLLTDDKKIRDQDRRAIKKAVDQGVKIALITGRMPAATEPIARELGISCIMACNAGTYILEEDECIHTEYLSVDTMKGIYEAIKPFGIPLWIFRGRKWYVTGKDGFVEEEEAIIQYKAELASVDELAAKWDIEEGPSKILVGAGAGLVQSIHEILSNRQDVDMAYSAPEYLEIFPKGINKGKALRLICEKKGIAREESVAFGDQELDIPMLEEAGIAIAMGNAIEQLKEKADFVTKTNNEAGIAYAIEHYLMEEMEDQ